MGDALVIRGALVVAMDDERTVAPRDVAIDAQGRIRALLEPGAPAETERTLDATGRVLVPGLIQAHLHLCQTLLRGLCEDLPLREWLRERVWPLEAAHDPDSLRASALLGVAELLRGGTTAILDMGTTRHTDVLFEVARETGIRYTGGKGMMDAGEGVPPLLLEPTATALVESDRLAERWHGSEGGRLRYAYAPRSAITSTWDLLRSVGARARSGEILVQTHASEAKGEPEMVRQKMGSPTIQLLASLGLLRPETCLAHCVWPEPAEADLLVSTGAHVVHCPSSNLKLSSGVAPVADYLDRGVDVALGADGAAANNRLDAWEELRLAALLARMRDGADALPAAQAFELATLGGARALGLDDQIGSVEPGKWADLAILDLETPHAAGPDDVYTRLVFSARADDVRTVLVAGRVLVDEGRATSLDVEAVVTEAERQQKALVARAGVPTVAAVAV